MYMPFSYSLTGRWHYQNTFSILSQQYLSSARTTSMVPLYWWCNLKPGSAQVGLFVLKCFPFFKLYFHFAFEHVFLHPKDHLNRQHVYIPFLNHCNTNQFFSSCNQTHYQAPVNLPTHLTEHTHTPACAAGLCNRLRHSKCTDVCLDFRGQSSRRYIIINEAITVMRIIIVSIKVCSCSSHRISRNGWTDEQSFNTEMCLLSLRLLIDRQATTVLCRKQTTFYETQKDHYRHQIQDLVVYLAV